MKVPPEVMLPVTLHAFVDGSYSSADAVRPPPLKPPATSTCPPLSRVAVCSDRAVAMLPVTLQVSLTGSYSSADVVSPVGAAPRDQHLPGSEQRRGVA